MAKCCAVVTVVSSHAVERRVCGVPTHVAAAPHIRLCRDHARELSRHHGLMVQLSASRPAFYFKKRIHG